MRQPLKHDIYDLLERMIQRIVWATEQEKIDMEATVAALRARQGLGIMATIDTCPHPHTTWPRGARNPVCTDCGKDMT